MRLAEMANPSSFPPLVGTGRCLNEGLVIFFDGRIDIKVLASGTNLEVLGIKRRITNNLVGVAPRPSRVCQGEY